MKFRIGIILFVTLIATTALNAAQPVKARVPAGIGLLLLLPESRELVIYRAPKLERLAEITPKALPRLQFITSDTQHVPLVVTSRKPGFYRVVYDDGEREGWIDDRMSAGQFYRWEELLPKRAVSLISGLRKEFYSLKSSPFVSSATVSTIEKGRPLTVLSLEGIWMQVITETGTPGWIRWQDENSRLVIGFAI